MACCVAAPSAFGPSLGLDDPFAFAARCPSVKLSSRGVGSSRAAGAGGSHSGGGSRGIGSLFNQAVSHLRPGRGSGDRDGDEGQGGGRGGAGGAADGGGHARGQAFDIRFTFSAFTGLPHAHGSRFSVKLTRFAPASHSTRDRHTLGGALAQTLAPLLAAAAAAPGEALPLPAAGATRTAGQPCGALTGAPVAALTAATRVALTELRDPALWTMVSVHDSAPWSGPAVTGPATASPVPVAPLVSVGYTSHLPTGKGAKPFRDVLLLELRDVTDGTVLGATVVLPDWLPGAPGSVDAGATKLPARPFWAVFVASEAAALGGGRGEAAVEGLMTPAFSKEGGGRSDRAASDTSALSAGTFASPRGHRSASMDVSGAGGSVGIVSPLLSPSSAAASGTATAAAATHARKASLSSGTANSGVALLTGGAAAAGSTGASGEPSPVSLAVLPHHHTIYCDRKRQVCTAEGAVREGNRLQLVLGGECAGQTPASVVWYVSGGEGGAADAYTDASSGAVMVPYAWPGAATTVDTLVPVPGVPGLSVVADADPAAVHASMAAALAAGADAWQREQSPLYSASQALRFLRNEVSIALASPAKQLYLHLGLVGARVAARVTLPSGRVVTTPAVGPVEPAPPRIREIWLSAPCAPPTVGTTLTARAAYYGGVPGACEWSWIRVDADGNRSESEPLALDPSTPYPADGAADPRLRVIGPEDVGCMFKVQCEPVRVDGERGAPSTSKPCAEALP